MSRGTQGAVEVDFEPDKDPWLAGWQWWDSRQGEGIQKLVIGSLSRFTLIDVDPHLPQRNPRQCPEQSIASLLLRLPY